MKSTLNKSPDGVIVVYPDSTKYDPIPNLPNIDTGNIFSNIPGIPSGPIGKNTGQISIMDGLNIGTFATTGGVDQLIRGIGHLVNRIKEILGFGSKEKKFNDYVKHATAEITHRVVNYQPPRELFNVPPVTNTSEFISEADKAIAQLNKMSDPNWLKEEMEKSKNALAIAVALMAAPEATMAAFSAFCTTMAVGSVSEALTIEALMSPAVMQMAQKAGIVLGGNKLLNLFGMFKATPQEAVPLTKHAAEGMTVEQVIAKALELGTKTEKDKLLLWSALGGAKGVRIAEEFAKANGYTTLEMTPAGKWLTELNLYAKNTPFREDQIKDIWIAVSKDLVKNAEGEVHAIVGDWGFESVYYIERWMMKANDKITSLDEYQFFLDVRQRMQPLCSRGLTS